MKFIQPLDIFNDPSQWLPVASGLATLWLSVRQRRLGMMFNFNGGGGFVVARRVVDLKLPERFRLHLHVNGNGLKNRMELKLSDESGANVWWYHPPAATWPSSVTPITIESREIEFAWGPAGGGRPSAIHALEIAIVAEEGGQGELWIEGFSIENLSAQERTSLLSTDNETVLDLHEIRSFAALEFDWGTLAESFEISISNDAKKWTTIREVNGAEREQFSLYLGEVSARYVRVRMQSAGQLNHLRIIAIELVSNLNAFFHRLAKEAPKGQYPKYWLHQQSYWTPISSLQSGTQALINEEGMIEVDRANFSLEPMVATGTHWISWADATHQSFLENDIHPRVSRVMADSTLDILAWAVDTPHGSNLLIRYRLRNDALGMQQLKLCVTLRPFQITPPWQAYREFGGVSQLNEIEVHDKAIVVNTSKWISWLETPTSFQTGHDLQQCPTESNNGSTFRPVAKDASGLAWGSMVWEWEIPPSEFREVHLCIPFGTSDEKRSRKIHQWVSKSRHWNIETAEAQLFPALQIEATPAVQPIVDTMRTAAFHILANRDGHALQPGPRRYARSWIRDGVMMGAALLRMGNTEAMRDFLRWYAPHITPSGNVPCCVDRSGPDWLPEHDSHGQWIYSVMEYYRFTKDIHFLREMQPSVNHAVHYLQALRASRTTAEYEAEPLRQRFGLLPESASHEGYLAHPVHSYWDSIWAIRGLSDAAELHRLLGHEKSASDCASEALALRHAVQDSLRLVIAERGIPYVPGSVEWADFDPTATACAVALLDEADLFPAAELEYTFREYLAGLRKRKSGEQQRTNYSAYEIRIIGALIRLGRRNEAVELIEYFLADRRPVAWRQWPEITWPDPNSPGHLGDLPHSWIGAEFILAARSMFAIESGEALILGAGIPDAWLMGNGVTVRNLPTWFGEVSYELRHDGRGQLEIILQGSLQPPGGFLLQLNNGPIAIPSSPAQLTIPFSIPSLS